jgi:hypothetical protein
VVCASGVTRKIVKMSNGRFAIGSEDGVPSVHVFMERDVVPTLGRMEVLVRVGRETKF